MIDGERELFLVLWGKLFIVFDDCRVMGKCLFVVSLFEVVKSGVDGVSESVDAFLGGRDRDE